ANSAEIGVARYWCQADARQAPSTAVGLLYVNADALTCCAIRADGRRVLRADQALGPATAASIRFLRASISLLARFGKDMESGSSRWGRPLAVLKRRSGAGGSSRTTNWM